MKTGNQIILDERRRQVEVEKYTLGHDDKHDDGCLLKAAECYEVNAAAVMGLVEIHNANYFSDTWPWDSEYWKPSTPLRDLTKAGALYLAEADRLKRMMEHFKSGDAQRIAYSMMQMSNLKIRHGEAESCADRCAQKIDALRMTRWQKFKRWLRGGYEYGHTGHPTYNIIDRRCVRTGVISYNGATRWVETHPDHNYKFVRVDVPVHYVLCPECKGSPLHIQCGKCGNRRQVLQWVRPIV